MEEPSVVFTPQDKSAEPELGHSRIPVDRYVEPAYLRLEDAHLWSKTWLLAGVVSDLCEAGRLFCFLNHLRESILVTRAEDGLIRAFYNVCQHRGNQLKGPGLWSFSLSELRFSRVGVSSRRSGESYS